MTKNKHDFRGLHCGIMEQNFFIGKVLTQRWKNIMFSSNTEQVQTNIAQRKIFFQLIQSQLSD